MKAVLSVEQLERRRRILRWIILAAALLLAGVGYALLAVPPDSSMEEAINRAFLGIGLLVAGFIVGMCRLLVP
jgi:hypothetical protein